MGQRKYLIFSTGGRCQWLMKRWNRFSLFFQNYLLILEWDDFLPGCPYTDFQVDHLLQVVGPPGPSTQVQWEHDFSMIDKNDNSLLIWLEKSKLFLLRSGNTISFKSSYAQNMPKICQRYAKDMSKICLGYDQDMLKIYQDTLKICSRYVKDMRNILWHCWGNLKQYLTMVDKISKTSLSHSLTIQHGSKRKDLWT